MTFSWRQLKDQKKWRHVWGEARNALRYDKKYYRLCVISWVSLLFVITGLLIGLFTNKYLGCVISMTGMIFALYFGNKKLIMIDNMAILNLKTGLTNRWRGADHGHF